MAQAADGNWYGYFGDSLGISNSDHADNNLDYVNSTAVGVVTNSSGAVWINDESQGYGDGVLNQAPRYLSNHQVQTC